MKTVRLFALLGMVVLLGACKKEKEIDSDSIVGRWNVDKITYALYVGNVQEGKENSLQNQGWFQFEANKTGVFSAEDNFNWNLSGNKLTITFPSEPDPHWLQMISGFPGELELNGEDNMVLQYSIDENEGGVVLTHKITFNLSRTPL